jgi:hypothetical protein
MPKIMTDHEVRATIDALEDEFRKQLGQFVEGRSVLLRAFRDGARFAIDHLEREGFLEVDRSRRAVNS